MISFSSRMAEDDDHYNSIIYGKGPAPMSIVVRENSSRRRRIEGWKKRRSEVELELTEFTLYLLRAYEVG